MKENYTKSLLERPVKSSVKTTEKETESSTSTTSTIDKLEEKLKIFEKLHNDFGKSNIVSLRPVNEKIEMVLENTSGSKGNFSIAFENHKPYLIDGIRVEIDQR